MSNPSKRKGSSWEMDLLKGFRSRGYAAERLSLSGRFDESDMTVTIGGATYCIEAKATRQIDLAGGLAELAVEREHYAAARGLAQIPQGILIVKRRNHSWDRAYAVAELRDWIAQVDQVPF